MPSAQLYMPDFSAEPADDGYVVFSICVFGTLSLALVLVLFYLKSLTSWLVWGTSRVPFPWLFCAALVSCLAAVGRERWRHGGSLAYIRGRRGRVFPMWAGGGAF